MSERHEKKNGQNTAPYLSDGSGCEACNFTGRFGGWIGSGSGLRWTSYPQIKCSHCAPSKDKQVEAVSQ